MLEKKQFIKIIRSNELIFISILFFISWKFFLIKTLFHTDFNDPRFNDASVYIYHIKSILECPLLIFCKSFIDSFSGYGGFEHLTYRLFFGTLGRLLDLNSQDTFFLSFYIGTLMLIPTLILFLKKINPDKNLLAFSLFFLALYNGAGSYHGFFWVVPSFFSLLLFLLIFVVINSQYKRWRLYLFMLIPSMLYTHYLGLYMIFILFLFFLFHSLLNGSVDREIFKRSLFTVLIVTLFYIPTSIYLKPSPYGGNPYGIETFSAKITQTLKNLPQQSGFNDQKEKNYQINNNLLQYFPSFRNIKTDYFDFLFPHWIFMLIFLTIIGTLHFYRQNTLLSLFYSSTIFTLISSISEYGVRSLIITWPITYILYAYGSWFMLKLIKDKIINKTLRNSLIGIMIVSLIIFITANLIYSYAWNNNNQISVKKIFITLIMNKIK